MSLPCPSGGEGYPAPQESERILESMRESILRAAYEKFDDAMAKEAEERRVYVMEAPVDTPSEDVLAIMLTKDGVKPFVEESQTKEQLILYFPSDIHGLIWIEHIRDGMNDKFSLDKFGLEPYSEAEDLLDADWMTEQQTAEPEAVTINMPVSAQARLSMLREKVERFQLTVQ